MIRSRQKELLKKIVATYIKTAEPVSSSALTGRGLFDVSSATIRNEMLELAEAGYVYQPHTSSGRVPTAKGYLFYVENYVLTDEPSPQLTSSIRRQLDKLLQERSADNLKNLAKILADLSDSLTILAFDEDRFFFTGLSYLYSQPEFREQAAVTSVSAILDHCEQVLPEIFAMIRAEKRILIGRDNPFGIQCSFMIAPLGRGLIGILGPLRMDYQRNFDLIDYIMKHVT